MASVADGKVPAVPQAAGEAEMTAQSTATTNEPPSGEASQSTTQDDERLAQELQAAEDGQAVPPRVVIGTPVDGPGPGHTPGLAHMGGGPLPPHGVAMIIEERPLAEVKVMSYKMGTFCFASIDIMSTLLNVTTLANRRFLGLWGLILLIGPICGVAGACQLNRTMVAIYLAFCAAKIIWEIFLAVLLTIWSFGWFLWFLLIALIQVWITKIVAEFWVALGQISPERRLELLRGEPEARPQMVYW